MGATTQKTTLILSLPHEIPAPLPDSRHRKTLKLPLWQTGLQMKTDTSTTSPATFKLILVGPHEGITEVPSAKHVPLPPDTPLLCSISILLSVTGVPGVAVLTERKTRTVNIKGELKFRQSSGCGLHCLGDARGNVTRIPQVSSIESLSSWEGIYSHEVCGRTSRNQR